MWGLYKTQPSFVLGFHGCDEDVGMAAIAGKGHLDPSQNEYDWLGSGIYFWEGSPLRAMEWAESVHLRHPNRVKKPFVVGAIIDLGVCCNLTDRSAGLEVRESFNLLQEAYREECLEMPTNKGNTTDRLLRYRDRLVIEFMHQTRHSNNLPAYNTVRAPFLEGNPLFDGAGLRELSHIQIAVRDPAACIKGYFHPVRQK